MKTFVDRYAPQTLNEVAGQDAALAKLAQAVSNKGVALLHGPPGTGKTCSAYALARDKGFEILELNASDFRDQERIHQIVGSSLRQASLFHKGKIVLVDELEGIAGAEDRGGLQELNKLLDERQHAVVLIANDPWDKKFSTIRKKSTLIEFKALRAESVMKRLKTVCGEEKIGLREDDMKTLARRSGGDLRAALTDLQVLSAGVSSISADDFNVLGEREQPKSVFTALQVILKGKDGLKALEIMDVVDVDLDEMMLWLEENIGREYRGDDLVEGYDVLGKADVFRGRIRKWQYWRFLVYVRMLMSAGVASVKKGEYYGYTPYKRYGRILKIWMANQKHRKRKDISVKLGRHCSVPSRYAAQYLVPHLQAMHQHGQDIKLPLTEEEREWLREKKA